MTNLPEFKSGFKYQNIGNIVGTLNYAKELKRQDDSVYGWEFLINAKGFGSVNVRIPMMQKAQASIDNYPVEDKPKVRAGLSRIEQFTADSGKTYTNATTFVELSDAVTAAGVPMKDNIAGRVAGEVFNIQPASKNGVNFFQVSIIIYSTDRDDDKKRAFKNDGTPVDPQVLVLEVHDPQIINQIQQTVTLGSNIEVGYKYLNKSDVQYDDYGFPINDPNSTIERLEIGKVVVHSGPQQGGQGFGGGNQGFGGQQQGGFGGGQQQGGFGGQQQQSGGFGNQGQQGGFGGQQQQQQQQQGGQQGFGDPNQYSMPDNQIPFTDAYNANQGGFGGQNQGDPFANGQTLQQGTPEHDEAMRMFGNGGQGQGGFGFGN